MYYQLALDALLVGRFCHPLANLAMPPAPLCGDIRRETHVELRPGQLRESFFPPSGPTIDLNVRSRLTERTP